MRSTCLVRRQRRGEHWRAGRNRSVAPSALAHYGIRTRPLRAGLRFAAPLALLLAVGWSPMQELRRSQQPHRRTGLPIAAID